MISVEALVQVFETLALNDSRSRTELAKKESIQIQQHSAAFESVILVSLPKKHKNLN